MSDDNDELEELDLELRDLVLNSPFALLNGPPQPFPRMFMDVLRNEGILFDGDEHLIVYDSDDDSFFEEDDYLDDDEEEDYRFKKIFVSLQDSHAIRRLSFHKKIDGRFRLPRISAGRTECYEDLYRLLEEVELLGKVWRGRLHHPYTAHIRERQDTKPQAASVTVEGSLVEGEDYHASDYECEGSEDEFDSRQVPLVEPNEALSKKKFCQSVKFYHYIFDSEKKFDQFLRTMARMRKEVFRVTFQVFVETLPPEVVTRLPSELWEKIWKYTQNDYFRCEGSLPLVEDKKYLKAGLRAAKTQLTVKCLEQARLKELFGAVGNLHILLFEILFKIPYLVLGNSASPLFELERYREESLPSRQSRTVWWRYWSRANQAFARFKHLEQLFNPALVTEEEGHVNPSTELTTVQKIEKGVYSVHSQPSSHVLKGGEDNPCIGDYFLSSTSSPIVSTELCHLYLIFGNYFLNSEAYVCLLLCDALDGQTKYVIKTTLKYSIFQIDTMFYSVQRTGRSEWKRKFCITQDRLSYMHCETIATKASVKIWTFKLGNIDKLRGDATFGEPIVIFAGEPVIQDTLVDLPENSTVRSGHSSYLAHSSHKLLLCFQNPFTIGTILNVYDEVGEMVLNIEMPGDVTLLGLKQNRALLLDHTARAVILFSIDSGEPVATFAFDSLNDAGSREEAWHGIMDSGERMEFAIYNTSLTRFRLFVFDPSNEMRQPEVIVSGCIQDCINTGDLNHAKLIDGLLYFNRKWRIKCQLSADDQMTSHDVSVLALRSQAIHPLITLGATPANLCASLLNELDLHHFDRWPDNDRDWPKYVDGEIDYRPLFLLDSTRVGVFPEHPAFVFVIDLGGDEKTVLEKDLKSWVPAANLEKSKALERREKKEKQMAELAAMYVDTGKRVGGKVVEWRGTFGFIRSNGPVRILGRVFFHRNCIENVGKKRFIKAGTELEFCLTRGRENTSLRAVKVQMINRPQKPKDETKPKGSGEDGEPDQVADQSHGSGPPQ